MIQLKFGDLLTLYFDLIEQFTTQEILDLPVYLGNDDELNGIHCGWNCELLDVNSKADICIIDEINNTAGNYNIEDKAILIS